MTLRSSALIGADDDAMATELIFNLLFMDDYFFIGTCLQKRKQSSTVNPRETHVPCCSATLTHNLTLHENRRGKQSPIARTVPTRGTFSHAILPSRPHGQRQDSFDCSAASPRASPQAPTPKEPEAPK